MLRSVVQVRQHRQRPTGWAASRLVVALLAVVLALGVTSPAMADTPPTYTQSCSVAFDEPTCERTEAAVTELAGLDDDLQLVWYGIWILAGIVTFGWTTKHHWDGLFNWSRNPV